MANNLKLALTISAVDRASGALRKIEERLKGLGQAAGRMETRLGNAKGQQAAIKANGKLDQKLDATAAKLRTAAARTGSLTQRLKASAAPTAALAAKLGTAQEATSRLATRQREQVSGLVRLRRELGEAKGAVGELGAAERRLTSEATRLTSGLERQARAGKAAGDLRMSGKMLMGAAMMTGGLAMGASIGGAALRRQLGSVISPAMDYSQQLALIGSMPGIGPAEAQALGRRARAYTGEHAVSLGDYMEGVYRIISSGQAGRGMIQALVETSAATAKTARGNTPDTADLVTMLQRNFSVGHGIAGARRVGDLVASTQQAYQIKDLEQLRETVQYASSSALANRINLGQLMGVSGLLNNAGEQSTMAGTAIQDFLVHLPGASGKLGFMTAKNRRGGTDILGTLENLSAKFGDLSKAPDKLKVKLQQAFGIRGIALVNLLEPKISQYIAEEKKASRHVAGASLRGQAKIEAGASDQLVIARNNFANLKIAIGTALLPSVKDLLHAGNKLARWFTGFAKHHKTLVEVTGAVLALAAGLLTLGAPVLAVASSIMLVIAAKRMLNAHLIEGAKAAAQDAGKIGRLRRGLGALRRGSLAAGRGILAGAKATSRGLAVAASATARGIGRAARSVGLAVAAMAKGALVGLVRVGAGLKGLILANPGLAALVVTLVALGAAVYEVVTHWRELTAESHTSIKVSPALARQLRDNTATRMNVLRGALAGNIGERKILENVFPQEPYNAIFAESDARRRDRRLRQLRADARLTKPATVNQHVHITVNGVTEPRTVADLVREHIERASAAARRGVLGDPVTL